jgi:hypothetical protein
MGALLLFSTWLSLTIACQSHRGATRIAPFDDLALIPRWTFFAPKPGTTDFQVLFRDRLFDDQLTSWRELDSSSGSVYLRWIWNPDKRKSKAIFDIAITLPGTVLEDPTDASTVVSIPYLCLLKQACSAPRNRLSVETQFAVAMTSGIAPPREHKILLTSRFHRL